MLIWDVRNQHWKKYGLRRVLSYYHFIVYDFETILAPINEHPTDDLTYLSRHMPVTFAT